MTEADHNQALVRELIGDIACLGQAGSVAMAKACRVEQLVMELESTISYLLTVVLTDDADRRQMLRELVCGYDQSADHAPESPAKTTKRSGSFSLIQGGIAPR